MVSSSTFHDHCLRTWHRQIASRDWRRLPNAARSSVAAGYMRRDRSDDNLIQVENLAIVILYCDRPQSSLPTIRLAGFIGSQIPWGVRWGGEENTLFDKDLGLPPVNGTFCRSAWP